MYDLGTAPELDDVVALMERYHDTPMDYADGTLVRLAERNRRLRLVLDGTPSRRR